MRAFLQVGCLCAVAVLAFGQAPQYRAAAPPQYQAAAPQYQAAAPQYQAAAPQAAAAPAQEAQKIAFNPAAVHFVQIGQKLEGDYKFGYDSGKQPDNSQSFREETRLPDGTVKGAYGFIDATGKQRIVRYTAGKNGFQADGDIYLDGAPKGTVPAGPVGVGASQAAAPQPQPQAAPQYAPQPAPQYTSAGVQYSPAGNAGYGAQGGYRAQVPSYAQQVAAAQAARGSAGAQYYPPQQQQQQPAAAAPSLPSFGGAAGGQSAEKKYEDGQYNPEFTKAGLYYPDLYEKLPPAGSAPQSRQPAFVDPALFNYNIGATKKQ